MRVYISASVGTKAREAALLIGTMWGFELTSRWFDSEKPKAKDADGWAVRVAENLAAVERADVVVSIPDGKWALPGIQVEAGYALRAGTPVVVLSPHMPTPLLHHPLVTLVRDADGLEAKLKQLAETVTVAAKQVGDSKPARKGRTQKEVTK